MINCPNSLHCFIDHHDTFDVDGDHLYAVLPDDFSTICKLYDCEPQSLDQVSFGSPLKFCTSRTSVSAVPLMSGCFRGILVGPRPFQNIARCFACVVLAFIKAGIQSQPILFFHWGYEMNIRVYTYSLMTIWPSRRPELILACLLRTSCAISSELMTMNDVPGS